MLSALRTDNSPFTEQQLTQLKISLADFSIAQSQWLSGYLAGHLTNSAQTDSVSQSSQQNETALSVFYGSETGNGETIAESLAAKARQQGIHAEILSLDNLRPATLRKLEHAVFVVSTHGEGDPPDEAQTLFEYLSSERAAKLPNLNYRILALGDRSYQFFCKAGRDLDSLLQQRGARPFGELVECDVDYTANAENWSSEVLGYASDQMFTAKSAITPTHLSVVPVKPRWSRQQPFAAQIERIQKITASQSSKDVHHLELSLQDSGLNYQPGDALGVWAPNNPQLVNHILKQLQIDADSQIVVNNTDMSIHEALTDNREITRLAPETIHRYALLADQSDLAHLYDNLEPEQQRQFIQARQLADLVDEYPASLDAQALVDLLRPLASRSYSIASSQHLVDEEVHLTVASLHSNAIGTNRDGVASHYLNQRLSAGDKVRVFLEPNRRFRLPENSQTPVIMIAAGTGIAPYRAFMQEMETNAGGSPDSWLIFGNPHLRTDFLYQKEWLHWRDSGLLSRIDTAWSRDQANKHYVQNVVLEQASLINDWLLNGAHIYLCGSIQMGREVMTALQNALVEQRGLSAEEAADTLAELRRERRIQKDLY